MCLDLLKSLFISLSEVLLFSLYKSCTFIIGIISEYIMVLVLVFLNLFAFIFLYECP